MRLWALLFGLWLVFLASPVGAQESADFGIANRDWNGLSDFVELAQSRGYPMEARSALDYNSLNPEEVLVILHPTSELNGDAIQAFVSDGGRVLLFDDYGSADDLLEGLSEPILRQDELPPGIELSYYQGNPHLPVIPTPGIHPLLKGDIQRLVANHSTSFLSELPAVIYLGEGRGFVYDLTLGEGKIIVGADPSLFINLMLGLGDNRAFASNTIDYLCEGRERCQLKLYTGAFASRGSYGDEPKKRSDFGAWLEESLQKLNTGVRDIESWLPEERLVQVLSILFAIGLGLFGLTVFPSRGAHFLNIRLRPPKRLWARSRFERLLEDYAKASDYALPLAILKDEFEQQLYSALYRPHEIPDLEERVRPAQIEETCSRYLELTAHEPEQVGYRKLRNLLRRLTMVPPRSQLFLHAGTRWSSRDFQQIYDDIKQTLRGLRPPDAKA